MDMQMTQPTKTKRIYPALKIDRDKVKELAEKNVRPTDIAKQQGVAISTITRYLENIGLNRTRSELYAKDRAIALTQSQLKKHAIEDAIIDHWMENIDTIKSQDVRLQKEIVYTVAGARNLDYQQERLETGKSTQNVQGIYHIISEIERSERKQVVNNSDIDGTSGKPDADSDMDSGANDTHVQTVDSQGSTNGSDNV